MANALHDENRVPTLLAQSTDGSSTVPLVADALGHLVAVARSSFSYANITTNTTTAVSTTAGVLHNLVVNTGGSASSAVLYDAPTSTGATIATAGTTGVTSLGYDLAFSALTVVTTGVGAADLTVVYR